MNLSLDQVIIWYTFLKEFLCQLYRYNYYIFSIVWLF